MIKEAALQNLIEHKILIIRGQKVMLDKDLADFYGVATRNLNKAVSRNLGRFPDDFMFQLTTEEFNHLKFHFGTSRWGGTRKRPRVFTEQGVAMLSSVLKARRAVQVNIVIMRTFVRLRGLISVNRELAKKLDELEKRSHKHEAEIREIFEIIRQLMMPSKKPVRQIGFVVGQKDN